MPASEKSVPRAPRRRQGVFARLVGWFLRDRQRWLAVHLVALVVLFLLTMSTVGTVRLIWISLLMAAGVGLPVHLVGARLTGAGYAILGLVAFLSGGTTRFFLAEQTAQANYLLALASLLTAGLWVNLWIARQSLRRVEVSRDCPAHANAGEPILVSLRVKNRSRLWPVLATFLADRPPAAAVSDHAPLYLQGLAPGKAATFTYYTTMRKRGRVRFSAVRLLTHFPFRLVRLERVISLTSALLVFPAEGRLLRAMQISQGNVPEVGGHHAARTRATAELFGVRDYRVGDETRHIAWKATARHDSPVVREFEREELASALIVLDVNRWDPGWRGEQAAETAISLAATLTRECLLANRPVALLGCLPRPVYLPPRLGPTQYWRIQEVLARVPLVRTPTLHALRDWVGRPELRRSQVYFIPAKEPRLLDTGVLAPLKSRLVTLWPHERWFERLEIVAAEPVPTDWRPGDPSAQPAVSNVTA